MQAALLALRLQPAQLVQCRGHELLAAEAGLHAHHQHQVQLVQIGGQRLRGGAGLDGQARLAAQRLHGIQRLLDIVLAFQMEVVQGGTRLDEGFCVLQRVADHQMHIVKGIRQGLVQALEHRHAKADVGHKVAVHHVVVQHLCTGVQHRAAVRAQLAKISRKDRRTYNRHSISLRSVIFKSFYPQRPGIFPDLRFPECRGMDIFSLHENAQKIKPAGLFFTEKS